MAKGLGYCACCKNLARTQRPGMGSAGISMAADVRDGVNSAVCKAQPEGQYDYHNLSEDCKRDMEHLIRLHNLKLIAGGTVAVEWRDEEQRYRKVFTVRSFEQQWLWDPRVCPLYEYNPEVFSKTHDTGKVTVEDEGDPELVDFYLSNNPLEG